MSAALGLVVLQPVAAHPPAAAWAADVAAAVVKAIESARWQPLAPLHLTAVVELLAAEKFVAAHVAALQ